MFLSSSSPDSSLSSTVCFSVMRRLAFVWVCIWPVFAAAQTDIQWTLAGNGNWGTTTNWAGSNVPNAAGERALFSAATGRTITLDNNYSVGGIRYASGAGSYTISRTTTGTRAITFNNSYGILHEDDSSQTISGSTMRLTLSTSTSFNVASTGNLSITATGGVTGLAANRTLTLTGSSTGVGTISGAISGTSGRVVKEGSGRWVLSGNSSALTGGVTVNAGTLRAETSANSLGGGAATLILGGGTLELANNTALSFNRNTTVSGNATIKSDRISAGAGVTHTLGTLSIGSNTLTIERGSLATSGTGGITFGTTTTTGNATLSVGANALLTLGALGDGGSADTITKSGTGTLTLGTAAGTITNGTALNVTAGTVNSNNATALGTLTNVTVSAGATVNLGASQTFGALNGASGATVALGTNTLTVGSTNNLSGTYGGTLTGSGNLVKAGTGTLTLSGATGFSGTTSVNAGTLNIQNNSSLGTGTGSVTVTSGATLQQQGGITVANRPLTLGGTLESVSGTNNWHGNITLNANASILSSTAGQEYGIGKTDFTSTITMGANTLTAGGAGDIKFNSFVGQSGDTGGFIKTGSGTVTFYGDRNYYTGTTDVRDGVLVLDTLDDIYNPDLTILGNLIIGDGTGSAGSAEVQFGSVASANNKIANTSNVTINSDGVLNLNDRADRVNALEFTGGSITLGTAGTLTILGDVTTNASSQTATISGNQFALSDNPSTIRTFTVANGAAASDLTISAQVAFGGITKQGSGTMTLTGNNIFGGAATVSQGVLNIQHANALGATAGATTVDSGAELQIQGVSIAVGNETLNLNGTGVSDTGALRNISGTNSWAGPIVLGSTSRINSDNDTLTINGTVTGTGNLLVGGSGDTTINGDIGTGSGTLTKDGTGTLVLTGNNTFSGATTVDAGVLNIRSNDALGSTLAGTTVDAGAALQLQNNITVGSEALSISGSGISDTGALRNISGANTYGGAITVASATARINADAGSLTVSGVVAVAGNALSIGGAANTTITGQLTGTSAGSITKDGASTLTLSNSTNTFAGDLGITQGTVALGANNSLNSSSIDVNIASGAELDLVTYAASIGTLAGLGNVEFGGSGQLTLLANTTFGGTFSGTGTLVVGSGVSLTLGADFNAPGITIVLAGGTLNVNGTNSVFAGLSLTGNSAIDFDSVDDSMIQFTNLSLGTYSLAVSGWTDEQDFFRVTNDPGNKAAPPLNQVTFAPSGPHVGDDTIWTGDYPGYTYNDEVRPWKPVPEPSTYGAMLMAAGLAALGYRRWRSAKRA